MLRRVMRIYREFARMRPMSQVTWLQAGRFCIFTAILAHCACSRTTPATIMPSDVDTPHTGRGGDGDSTLPSDDGDETEDPGDTATPDRPGPHCSSCHGGEESAAPPRDTGGHTDTTATGVGAHQGHLKATNWHRQVLCDDCHQVPLEVGDVGHIDTLLPAEVVLGPVGRSRGVVPQWDGERCTNYCHGATLTGGLNNNPTWTLTDGSQTFCGTCHGLPPLLPHPQQTDCSRCHDSIGSGFPELHIDGLVQHGGAGVTGGECESCHGHDVGYEYAPGRFSQGRGSFQSHSTHTERDGDDHRGPDISCETCHNMDALPSFRSGVDLNQNGSFDLGETDVCDGCHSPGGAFDGVDDPNIGAKRHWPQGVYNGRSLRTARWCAGCHDREGAGSRADDSGVTAPDVVGDNSVSGFYISGHGKDTRIGCTTCHDAGAPHIDHLQEALIDVLESGAQQSTGYRFYRGKGMEIPSDGIYASEDAALCYSCHEESWIVDDSQPIADLQTNFRVDDESLAGGNLHYVHTALIPIFSAQSCVYCHDPHGTEAPRMLGNGIGGFAALQGDGISPYVALSDVAVWNSPSANKGGALLNVPACAPCHLKADLSTGLGPTEGNYDGWYLRGYKPHTYDVVLDFDLDGILDENDNCPSVKNADQLDSDQDGRGDQCDTCPNIADAVFSDFDGDGIGDACDDSCDTTVIVGGFQVGTSLEESVSDVVLMPDGDLLMTGHTSGTLFSSNAGFRDVFVARYTSAGNLVWGDQRGTAQSDEGGGLVRGPGNSLYVAAMTNGKLFDATATNNTDLVVMKYDIDGTFVWGEQRGVLQQFGRDLAVDADGNAYVAGNPITLTKYDQAGFWVWETSGNSFFSVSALAIDSNDNLYAVGYLEGTALERQIQVAKYSNAGAMLWTKDFGKSTSREFGTAIYIDTKDRIFLTGYTEGELYAPFGGKSDIVVMEVDSSGTLVWGSQFGAGAREKANSIAGDDMGLWIGGSIEDTDRDSYLLRLDFLGNLMWEKRWRTPEKDAITEVVSSPGQSAVIMVGTTKGDLAGTNSNYGLDDIFVLKGAAICP